MFIIFHTHQFHAIDKRAIRPILFGEALENFPLLQIISCKAGRRKQIPNIIGCSGQLTLELCEC